MRRSTLATHCATFIAQVMHHSVSSSEISNKTKMSAQELTSNLSELKSSMSDLKSSLSSHLAAAQASSSGSAPAAIASAKFSPANLLKGQCISLCIKIILSSIQIVVRRSNLHGNQQKVR